MISSDMNSQNNEESMVPVLGHVINHNNSSIRYKFTRDDEQILALNYENLCDGDYLHRLFLLEGPGSAANNATITSTTGIAANIGVAGTSAIVSNNVVTAPKEENQIADQNRSTSESNISSSEFSEDVIIFGDNIPLGQMLFERRFNRELAAQAKFQDILGLQINRQAIIYEHMAHIMLHRFQQQKNECAVVGGASSNSTAHTIVDQHHLINDSLLSVFSLFREKKSSAATLKSFLVAVCLFFDSSNPEIMQMMKCEYFGEIRKMLYKAVSRISSPQFLELLRWNKHQYAEELRSALYAVYGFLALGILTSEISDIIIALNYFVAIIFEAELKTDKLLLRAKENSHVTSQSIQQPSNAALPIAKNGVSNNNNHSTGLNARSINTIPNMKAAKEKSNVSNKFSSKGINGASSNNASTNNMTMALMMETDDRPDSNLSVIADNMVGNNNNNESDQQLNHWPDKQLLSDEEVSSPPGSVEVVNVLKSPPSASKLWDKSGPTGERSRVSALPNGSDLLKSKVIPSKKGGVAEQRLLMDYLDKDTSLAVPNNSQNIIIANHVLLPATNYPATNAGNNKKESPSKPTDKASMLKIGKESNRDQYSNHVLTPRTAVKRIEKDIKESNLESFRVPQAIISILSQYSKVLGKGNFKLPNSVTQADNSTRATTKGGKSVVTKVWSCGQNSYGELGLGDVNMRKIFTHIPGLDEKCIVSIGAGNEHSLFVTKEGKLFTAGYNDNGQCGVGSTQQVRQPTLVQALEDEEILQVYVYNGCEHTIALTREGKVFSFGYNYRGQVSPLHLLI